MINGTLPAVKTESSIFDETPRKMFPIGKYLLQGIAKSIHLKRIRIRLIRAGCHMFPFLHLTEQMITEKTVIVALLHEVVEDTDY